MSLEQASSVLIQRVIVDLLEQWIVEDPSCSDIWQISCLINNKNFDSAIINNLVDQLVQHYDNQTVEIKRSTFVRFKQCLYHLHRLAFPFTAESCEHLTSLLVYQSLLIVRDYLRLFIYEPNNEHFVEVAQKLLQQPGNLQNIDIKRIKYIPEQNVNIETLSVDVRPYQSISFISLVNWISDLIFYLIGYLQLQQLPAWLPCKHLFNDYRQIQWLRELIIYFYVLLKTNKISSSKLAHLQPPSQLSNENQTNQRDILNDIYQSVSKLAQRLETKNPLQFEDGFLEELSVFEIELLQSKADGLFPKMSPFLIPNSEQIQTFGRGQSPSFAANFVGNPMHCDPLNTHNSANLTSAILNEDQSHDGRFDVISLNKLSISSSSSFRRCLRCWNFSRIYKAKPCPFLISRLNQRCICGGLFTLYNRSNSSSTTNNTVNNSGNTAETTAPPSNR